MQLQQVEITESWAGPIPPPAILQQYEQVLEGSAQSIIDSFVKQGDHRRSLEREYLDADSRRADRGQILAFVLALAFLIVAGALVWHGEALAGTTIGTVDLVALVTVFIVGRRQDQ